MSVEPVERRSRLVVLGPAAWGLAVVLALGVQLVVCVRGTDAESTLVRVAIVVLGVLSLAASIAGGLPAWRERRRRTDVEPPLDPTLAIAATTALGSVLLILAALLVPTNAVC
jgi:hypothetical protein